MSILRQCDHKNVARCHTVLKPASSYLKTFNHMWLVLELASTDLGALIKKVFAGQRPACKYHKQSASRCWRCLEIFSERLLAIA